MSQSVKIATILPYKENYTFHKAQAAAIWVCDFFKYSKFKNTNYIFGNTKGNDYLTKNYINISINNLKSKSGHSLPSIAFNSVNNKMGEYLLNYKKNLSVLAQIHQNFWNNKNSLQLSIRDLIL